MAVGTAACGPTMGSFPYHLPSVLVITAAQRSPTGWGLRRLTLRERAALSDVPILVQDSLVRSGRDQPMLLFTQSPPGKLLSLGTDVLVSGVVRGGFDGLQVGGPKSLCAVAPSSPLPDTLSAGAKHVLHEPSLSIDRPLKRSRVVGFVDMDALEDKVLKHSSSLGQFLSGVPPCPVPRWHRRVRRTNATVATGS